jgi:hypothetical protein
MLAKVVGWYQAGATSTASAGAGVGSSQKGILRVTGLGPRYADVWTPDRDAVLPTCLHW